VASGDCSSNYDLVQVSAVSPNIDTLLTVASFLLKDAQDDMAGQRLKA
jgi:hypothetical protein